MTNQLEDTESAPPTPDEFGPSSSSSVDSSDAGTPLDPPADPPAEPSSSRPNASPVFTAPVSESPVDSGTPRRVPSLRTVSDPERGAFMSARSSLTGTLTNARRPPPSAGNLPMDIMAKARALQAQRMGMSMSPRPGISPQATGLLSPGNAPTPMVSPLAGAMPGNIRLPMGMGRPGPPATPRSAPAVPGIKKAPSLSERRAMKLASMGSDTPGGASPTTNTPRLSDMMDHAPQDGRQRPSLNGEGRGSHINDFKNYIDTEKGWITFEGAATITRTGVNFASGQTFSISLDEIEVLDELGKGNYGIVYKVRHARPQQPRFGQGLGGFRPRRKSGPDGSRPSGEPTTAADDGAADSSKTTSGKVMAMKEIRLELDEAKFTTILKELVILHECVSPYIIDFYGAFFQEGAVYMCIEYMDGGSIDKLYADGIPEPVLRSITYATIMGLKSLKEDHNIIHRDVKPTNILVNTRGQVKICDFGVSGNLVASIAKTNIGCQSYMAPERISGGGMSVAGAVGGTYSVQSDIWSLGLTVIECAMGKYPYPSEVSSTIFSQLSAIVEGDPPDLPSEGYSATARDFVRSCLNKIPAQRHTYPMLLAHPWLKSLSQPVTISEDVEAEDAAAAGAPVPDDADSSLAKAAAEKLNINSGDGDSGVAAWVCNVLDLKQKGLMPGTAEKPALHAAPLDSVSPVTSPA